MAEGNGDAGAGPETKRRPFAWRDADLTIPEVQAHALVELAEHQQEQIRVHAEHRRELGGVRRAGEHVAEQVGQIFAVVSKMDRRSELDHARIEALTLKLGHVDQISDANRERLRVVERSIREMHERNAKIDAKEAAEAAEKARVAAEIGHLKERQAELEEDVEDTQNRRIDGIEKVATVLAEGVARASLSSSSSLEQHRPHAERLAEKADKRRTYFMKWALGITGFVIVTLVLAAVAIMKSKYGVSVETPPVPALPAGK